MNYVKPSSIWSRIPTLVPALFDCIARKLSARQAAEEISELAGQRMSRNALIGAARRRGASFLGIDQEHIKKPRKRNYEAFYKPRISKPPIIDLPAGSIPYEKFLGITVEKLERGQCRFPQGDDPLTMIYCGQPVEGETSWCSHHRSICFVRR